MSKLQGETAVGFDKASAFKIRIAAKRNVGFGEDKKSCKTM